VGFAFSKYKKIDLKSVNELVIYVTTPCLIVSSLSRFPIDLTVAGKIFLVMASILVVSMAVGLIVTKLLKLSYEIYLPPVLFGNTGNMGLPLCLFAFGQTGFNLGIICMVAMTILHYTVGIVILSSYKKPLEVFRLPLIYSTIIGLAISAFEYEIPVPIGRSIELLGDISIPAMMFALGYKLSELKLTRVWLSFLFGSMRIFLGFFLGIFFVRLFRLEGISAMVMILQSSMPPAVFNFVLAEKYKKDSETVASIIMAGTIISLLTIPLILTYLLDF